MTKTKAESVKLLAQVNSGRFAGWVNRAEQHWRDRLKAYRQRLIKNPPSGQHQIKDGVWGMIPVTAQELAVIDSPLFQRLRHIRQLGVSSLTFPTATHTRFDHSLGVAHQAERMFSLIDSRSRTRDVNVSPDDLRIVRLAALLHDIGHMPLSHVTERFFSLKECTDLAMRAEIIEVLRHMSNMLKGPTPSLSEVLSVCLVCTPSFQGILNVAQYSKQEVASACLIILGHPVAPKQAYLRQIITSVVDADKLDYMHRDSQMTNVPIAVDLARLLHKLCLREISPTGTPFTRIFGDEEKITLIATDISGEGQIKDVVLARTLLYQRVYLHHKTLAAERMILRALAQKPPHPVDLLAETDKLFMGEDYPLARYALVNRQLPRRQYAFTDQAPSLQEHHDGRTGESRSSLRPLVSALAPLDEPPSREALEKDIARIFNDLVQALGRRAELAAHPAPPYVGWFMVDAQLRFESPQINLPVFAPDDTRVGGLFPKTAPSYTQYSFGTFFIYSFLPDDFRDVGFVACEMAIFSKLNLRLGRTAADQAKVPWSAVEKVKSEYAKKKKDIWGLANYWALRPASPEIETAEFTQQARDLATRFPNFSVESYGIDHDRIRRFVSQFPEELVEEVMDLLRHMRYFKRDDFETAGNELRRDPKLLFTALPRETNESGYAMPHFMFRGDREADRCLVLSEALRAVRDSDQHLCFVDDWTLSGKQAQTGLEVMFGRKPTLPDEARHFYLLDDVSKAYFKKNGMTFYFLGASTEAKQALEDVGRSIKVNINVRCQELLDGYNVHAWAAAGRDSKSRAVRRKLIEFLKEVGDSLLKTTKGLNAPQKWHSQKCSSCALGYGNRALLVTSFLNTPTSTLTALWLRGGTIRGEPWIPLFPRSEAPEPKLKAANAA